MTIEKAQFENEGLNLVFDKGEWVVGIKNYKPANDIDALSVLERHNLTDEQFVLLKGKCVLLAVNNDNDDEPGYTVEKMEFGKVYNIPSGLWHTTIMEKGTKMILIEKSGTSMDNSDLLDLTKPQIEKAVSLIRSFT